MHNMLIYKKYLPLIIVILCLVSASIYVGPYITDDSMIVSEFAKNFSSGYGYSYNPRHLSSSSTPLHTLILSVCYFFTTPNPIWLFVLCWLYFAMLMFILCNYLKDILNYKYSILGIIIFGFFPLTLFYMQFGMDTMLTAFLIFLTIYTYHKYNDSKTLYKYIPCIFGGLAFLARYESAIVLVCVVIINLINRKFSTKEKLQYLVVSIGAFLLFSLPWLIFSQCAAGSIIPASLQGKTYAYQQLILRFTGEGIRNIILYSPILVFLSTFSLRYFKSLPNSLKVCALVVIFQVLIYSIVPVYSFRYVYPAFIGTILLGLYGYYKISPNISTKLKLSQKVVATGLIILIFSMHAVWYVQSYPEIVYWNARSNAYMNVVTWINKNLPKNSTIAACEHGYIGYYTDLEVIDYLGAIYPFEGNHLNYLKLRKPEYVYMITHLNISESQEGEILKACNGEILYSVTWDEKSTQYKQNRASVIKCNWD